MDHAFITIVIPILPKFGTAVDENLESLREPHRGNRLKQELEQAIDRIELIHFMSITRVLAGSPAYGYPQSDLEFIPSNLLIEITSDGSAAETIERLAECGASFLDLLLEAAGVKLNSKENIAAFMLRHHVKIGDSWLSPALGQVFCGSPGMSARRIRRETDLAQRVDELVREGRRQSGWDTTSPVERMQWLRNVLWEEGHQWAFVPESTPCLVGDPHNKWNPQLQLGNPQAWKAVLTIVHKLLWPLWWVLAGIVALKVAVILSMLRSQSPADVAWWWVKLIIATALLLATVILFAYVRLRRLERADVPEEKIAPRSQNQDLAAVENFGAQNHLASVSIIKPGLLRSLALRFAFITVGTGRFLGPPGFLGKNGVIHFARWMRLPGTNQLLFWSNYDGTWQSYVGDFIADAPTGVTGIWSNCEGFPRSRGLFGEGAANRDRLVNWARRQQQPTTLFYSAYPDLTTTRIRVNAAIRQGLAMAETDSDARDWFTLFGSAPRPAELLQLDRIPTLLFGGLSPLRHARCLVLTFSDSAEESLRRAWLKEMAGGIAYGPMFPGQRVAVVLGLSAAGLRCLGLPEEALATFPLAFQEGMSEASRARMLGDTEGSAPERWDWGRDGKAHVLLLLYADDASLLTEIGTTIEARVAHVARVHSIKLAPLPESGLPREPFGFRDGVSQPIIRGLPGWMTRPGADQIIPIAVPTIPGQTVQSRQRLKSSDVVQPGEFILGYPDNIGTIPPAPSIEASSDPHHKLADVGPDPMRRRPEFSRFEGVGKRDLGLNGSYLVVRQLRQHWEKLDAWADRALDQLSQEAILAHKAGRTAIVRDRRQGASNGIASQVLDLAKSGTDVNASSTRGALRDTLKAKLMGRWQDGTSLVRNPAAPGSSGDPNVGPDNDFLFGTEDPAGLACPFGAHVRRANPRDARFPGEEQEIATVNRHRILRVGRSYCGEETSDQAEGLLFMCLNANIERQFEFIQKTWLLNPNMHGLENEADPIVGRGDKAFTLPTATGPIRLDGIPEVVSTCGGEYFFLPGRDVLGFLCEMGGTSRS